MTRQTYRFVMRLGALLMLASVAGIATDTQAQATRGRDLYYNAPGVKGNPALMPCISCHAVADKVGRTAAVINNAINTQPSMAQYRNGALSLSPDMADLAAYLANPSAVPVAIVTTSPANLTFPAQPTGTMSAPMTITVSHGTGSGEGFSFAASNAIVLGGQSAAQYEVVGGTCTNGTTVALNANCTIQVRFRPTGVISNPQGEARPASLTLSFATPAVAPIQVLIAGTAVAAAQPSISLSKNSMAFAATPLGSTSNDSLTLTNNGTAALSITTLATGGANAADFTRGGSCTDGGTVAAGANCTISYAFAPAALGARAATLTIASNNPAGDVTVALSGSGIANTPVIATAPATLTFNAVTGTTSAPQTVTVTNTGGGTLSVSAVATGNAVFAATPSNCGALAFNQSCTISVTFAPAALGAVNATLTITHNAGAAATVALTGTGQSNLPVVAANPATVNVAALTAVGQQSAPTTVRITNNGPGAVTLSTVASGAEFPISTTGVASPCSNGLSIAQGAFCQVAVRFAPAAAGTRTGTLTFSTSGTPPSLTVPLSGNATATAAPELAFTPAGGPVFSVTRAGTTSESIRVTLTNRGTANMVFPASDIATVSTGFNPGDFRVSATTCVAATPLQPNTGNCTVDVTFAPVAAGDVIRSAVLTVNFSGGPAQIPLLGVVDGATGSSSGSTPPAPGGAPPPASASGGSGALPAWLAFVLLFGAALRRRYR